MLGLALALTLQAPCCPQVPPVSVTPPSSDPASPMALPLATLDDQLEIDGETVTAREVNSRLLVPVLVNGKGPYRFIVDSGADRSVVGQRIASQLALTPDGVLRLHAMAGIAPVNAVHVDTLTIGRSTLNGFRTPVLAERFLGADGMLGIDALVDQRVRLDFDSRSVVVEDARKPDCGQPGDIVVTARRQRGQLIMAAASARDTPILAVIDSGAELTLGNPAMRALVVRGRHPKNVVHAPLIDVMGRRIDAEIIVVPEITIGALHLKEVQIAFADVPPFTTFGLTRHPALLLGNDVLRAFRRVALDFRRRKVRFTLR